MTHDTKTAIAEFNWGRLLHDWTDKRVQPFVEGLERVNRLAERSPGFIWRMPDDEMETSQLGPPLSDHRVASTLSVWRSSEDLQKFVFNSLHGSFLKRGSEWFEVTDAPRYVLWPVDPAHRPGMEEGLNKIRHLEQHGASPECFDFRWFNETRELAGST